jgi:protein associated with RNAse G/E
MVRNMKLKTRKYGNKKVERNGVKFDSELELACHDIIKSFGFEFEFQKKIVLVDKFRYNSEAIRAITMIVDFVVYHNGITAYVDSKGFGTEVSKIKYKMLKNQLKEEENTQVVWLHSKKEALEFFDNLKKK